MKHLNDRALSDTSRLAENISWIVTWLRSLSVRNSLHFSDEHSGSEERYSPSPVSRRGGWEIVWECPVSGLIKVMLRPLLTLDSVKAGRMMMMRVSRGQVQYHLVTVLARVINFPLPLLCCPKP